MFLHTVLIWCFADFIMEYECSITLCVMWYVTWYFIWYVTWYVIVYVTWCMSPGGGVPMA